MNILDRIAALEKKVRSLEIIDSEDIIAENTGKGIMLHLEDPIEPEYADAYNDYFKVIDVSTAAVPADGETPEQPAVAKLKIVNGMNISAENCFSGYINKLKKDIPATEIEITESGILYLESVAVGNPATDFTCTFKLAPELPAFVDGKECTPISQVKFENNKIVDFSQKRPPDHIIVWGAC